MSPTDPTHESAWKLWLLTFLCAAFFVWILSKVIHHKKSSAARSNHAPGATDDPTAAFDEREKIDIANLRRFFFFANALPLRMLGAMLFTLMMRGLSTVIAPDAGQPPNPAFFISLLVMVVACLTALTWSARSYWHILLVVLVLLFTSFGIELYTRYRGQNIQYLDAVAIYQNAIRFSVGAFVYCLPLFIIRAIRNRLSPKPGPGQCQSCGYDLQGLTTPRCPECGQPFGSLAQPHASDEPLIPPA